MKVGSMSSCRRRTAFTDVGSEWRNFSGRWILLDDVSIHIQRTHWTSAVDHSCRYGRLSHCEIP